MSAFLGGMRRENNLKKRNICLSITVASVILLLLFEFAWLECFCINLPGAATESIEMIITRGLGGIVFSVLLIYVGFKVLNPLKKPFFKSIVFCIPAFCVVVNNLHIYTLAAGREKVTASAGLIALFALECFCVALFEEMAFRGVVLLKLLENKRKKTSDILIAILISSAIFGIIHLVNLLNSSPADVFMQIGYSFLIGAMCSVVLLRTHNIWLCVILHAIYNFCGRLVPRLGTGYVWDTPTVIITVIIALFTAVYMIYSLVKLPVDSLEKIYEKSEEADDERY